MTTGKQTHPQALGKDTRVHAYVIEKELGHGGFGITYLARHSHLNGLVAIKELFPNGEVDRAPGGSLVRWRIADEIVNRLLKHFVREAKALQRFETEPNIVSVRDVFEENNTAYLVMEYVEGKSFADHITGLSHRPSEAELQGLFAGVLKGLAAVHAAGQLHRDLSPNNILIKANGDSVLIDFGAVRDVKENETASESSSHSARIVTRGYSAPEAHRGKSRTPSLDIYSLGAVLYFAVTGKPPVPGDERLHEVHVGDGDDPLSPAMDVGNGNYSSRYSSRFLEAIDWALKLKHKDRPQNIRDWVERLFPPPKSPVEVLQGTCLLPGCVFRDWTRDGKSNPLFPEMVVILAGRFRMGAAPGEEEREGVPEVLRGKAVPQHEVSIARAFALGRTPVTVGQFAEFVRFTGHRTDGGAFGRSGMEWGHDANRNWRNPGFAQTDTHPVTCVNWEDAQAYLRWLSIMAGHVYCLASEAEWEYAARAGTATARFWGDGVEELVKYAQCANETSKAQIPAARNWDVAAGNTGYAYTSPVASFLPNKFGLYDMLGNVWEWVEDIWNQNYCGAPTDGSVWATGRGNLARVVRGGSWGGIPRGVRSANRSNHPPDGRYSYVGFRVAKPLNPIP